MSNIDPALEAIIDRGGEEAPEASIVEAQPHLEPQVEEEPEETPELTPAEPVEAQRENVPWSEYEKLRHENADYRKRWQPIEQAFDGVHPDDKTALIELVRTYANDPTSAATMMREYAEALAANGGEAVLETEPAAAPQQEYLTARDVERMLSEREAKRAETEAVAAIEREAQTMGYDPNESDYVALLHIASQNGGDLKAADAALKAKVKSQVEAELAKLRDLAKVPTPQIGGTQPSGEREINSIRDAAEATREMLNGLPS